MLNQNQSKPSLGVCKTKIRANLAYKYVKPESEQT